MERAEQDVVVKVQQDTQDSWTGWYRLTSWFRYPHISPLRRITDILSQQGVPRRSNMRVLEFGFGHGHALFWFKPPTRLYGVELSEQAIRAAAKRARSRGYAEFDFKKVALEESTKIDFPSGFFDLVISSHTLEHVWDDTALLHEFHRVLKPGGRLLIAVPHDLRHSQLVVDRDARRNPAFPASSYHVHNYNIETLAYLVGASRFEVQKAERFDAVMSWRTRWPRVAAILFSTAMPILPYVFFRKLDATASKAGHPSMQALVFAAKPLPVSQGESAGRAT
jgi:SAM-dependent methyltransferase